MHKLLIYNLLFLFFTIPALAQEPDETTLGPCGAPPGISPWLLEWHEQPEHFPARSSDTLYVGLQVHLLARDNGTGRLAPEKLLDAFCRLQQDFAASGVRFFFKNDWNLINNTGWHNHETIPEGIDMMLTNNYPDALNAYFVSGAAGNCGYNLPYAGVAIAHACADPGEHTWAHEVGHALSLPHTFIGWENTPYNFGLPTPDTLTYDYTYFHDSVETQVPAPLDTALVERLDGSNCGVAADLFCDTRPDYLNYRWNCDAQNESLVTLKDQTGATFKADGTLFMSYSSDVCSNRFSDEQIAALRANLLTEKVAWLAPGPLPADVSGLPELLSPPDGAPVPADEVALHWSAVPGATHYLVQVSRLSNYLVKNFDLVVTDTTFIATALPPNFTYYWRVRPFNYGFTCTEFTASGTFLALPASAVAGAQGAEDWRCYPTRLAAGQTLTLELPESWQHEAAQCQLFDAVGRLCWQSAVTPAGSKIFLQIPIENLPAGVYRFVLHNPHGNRTAPLIMGDF